MQKGISQFIQSLDSRCLRSTSSLDLDHIILVHAWRWLLTPDSWRRRRRSVTITITIEVKRILCEKCIISFLSAFPMFVPSLSW
jgi:hypothetical protein